MKMLKRETKNIGRDYLIDATDEHKQKTAWTKAEFTFAQAYRCGDGKTKGNAIQSYLLAYPNQGLKGALSHASEKLTSPGVQKALKAIEQQLDNELLISLENNKEIITDEGILQKLSTMVWNKPHPISGRVPFSDATTLKAAEIILRYRGGYYKSRTETGEQNVITGITINMTKPQEIKVIDTNFNNEDDDESC